jgi:hypothetical protein
MTADATGLRYFAGKSLTKYSMAMCALRRVISGRARKIMGQSA